MVGTGPLESKLSQMDVELLGNVEEEDLIQIYAKSDFLALPSRKEGFGLVWGEALSSGKPVLLQLKRDLGQKYQNIAEKS